jgi:hypothetical protein
LVNAKITWPGLLLRWGLIQKIIRLDRAPFCPKI